jgi:hypothetical protein
VDIGALLFSRSATEDVDGHLAAWPKRPNRNPLAAARTRFASRRWGDAGVTTAAVARHHELRRLDNSREITGTVSEDVDLRVEIEARAATEKKFCGGHDVLLADAATEWASHLDLIERLSGMAEAMHVPRAKARRGRPFGIEAGASFKTRAAARARDPGRRRPGACPQGLAG